ncbi:MAG: hypothetical protein LBE83_05555 [Propionibacteriaceae bacterium]|jgi:hypothetical protein|nr:hypothetical protein [Propionibacteriaceae bacterium]
MNNSRLWADLESTYTALLSLLVQKRAQSGNRADKRVLTEHLAKLNREFWDMGSLSASQNDRMEAIAQWTKIRNEIELAFNKGESFAIHL